MRDPDKPDTSAAASSHGSCECPLCLAAKRTGSFRLQAHEEPGPWCRPAGSLVLTRFVPPV
ncbi:MAG: hypothetical protein LBQ79_10720 [Deltaproteobacteria bacterium]|nr:hypothetical protein [Deltaproteobacteria bacterium]